MGESVPFCLELAGRRSKRHRRDVLRESEAMNVASKASEASTEHFRGGTLVTEIDDLPAISSLDGPMRKKKSARKGANLRSGDTSLVQLDGQPDVYVESKRSGMTRLFFKSAVVRSERALGADDQVHRWSLDIARFPWMSGKIHVACIIDLSNRNIIGARTMSKVNADALSRLLRDAVSKCFDGKQPTRPIELVCCNSVPTFARIFVAVAIDLGITLRHELRKMPGERVMRDLMMSRSEDDDRHPEFPA